MTTINIRIITSINIFKFIKIEEKYPLSKVKWKTYEIIIDD